MSNLLKKYYLLILLIIFGCSNKKDDEVFDSVVVLNTIVLPKIINETSGLEILNETFVTHNDSGGEPSLYFFNLNGEIINSIKLEEESFWKVYNNDWEDITADEDYIFIADIGNNFGNRNNLNIIKVKITDFSIVGKIDISYTDQETFLPRPKHKYDAEAIFLIEDKIAILSKDRNNFFTDLYLVDKQNNSRQVLESKITYDVNSLITGGDYDEELNLLALVSYNSKGNQYLILFENFSLEKLTEKQFKKFKIPLERAQVEAIKIIDKNTFWITSEDEGIGNPFMYKIGLKEKNAPNKTN
tara:strand:+ start:24202 stop:25101 length:900 start_codon:yes stop_codon:yes gene_type:complete